jgi:hypothetical protein
MQGEKSFYVKKAGEHFEERKNRKWGPRLT